MAPIIASLLGQIVPGLIDRVFPDQQAADAAKLEFLKLQQAGEFKQLDAELQVQLAQIQATAPANATEHPFIYGGRPAIIWICAAGLFYQLLLTPLLPWTLTVLGVHNVPPLPLLNEETLLFLTTSLLGLGGMRSYEKIKMK